MRESGSYELLIDKINVFIRKYYFNNLLRGLIFLGAGLFSAYVVITLSEYFGNFNTSFRTALFYAFILLNIGLLIWLVIPSLLAWLKLGKTITHDEAAEIIGRHFSHVSDKLLNTLQLKKLADQNQQHSQLIEASIDQKIEALKPVSFPSVINLKENNKYLKWLIFPAAVICILALAAPSILTESTKRLIHHNQYFAPLAPFKFVVLNKSLSAVQGEDVKLELKLTGDKFPSDVYVEMATNTFKLDKENISKFHYIFSNVQQNATFKLTANGYTSQPYEIRVNLKPSLLHFDVMLNYPGYLHKKNETLLNAGDLTIPAGTQVKWQLHTQNATGLLFTMNSNTVTVGSGSEGVFEHAEKVLKNSIYTINPVSDVVKRGDSASYRVNVIMDEMPSITVQEKPDSVSMKALYFNGRIQDDHGFTSLNFHYVVSEPGSNTSSEKTLIKPVKADLNLSQADFFYFWDLKELAVKPGQQVTYYFEVADNDGVAGPKKVRSPEHTLIVPTEQEINKQLNAASQSVKEKMQSAIKISGQVERDAQKLNQLLLNKNSLSFDEKKQIEDLLQKKKDLNDLVKDIQNENKKNQYNRQENQDQSQQLKEKQKEMEQLLNNVLDPKTQEMLQRLQQMLEEERKDSTRDELSKMQSDNKDLKKELDRMLELYKKLDFDQKLNQAVNQLNKLADQQNKVAEQTQKPNADQQSLQKDQDKISQDFKDVEKQLDDLKKADDQLEQKNNFEKPEKEAQSVEQDLNKSSESLQKNDKQKAGKSQQSAAKQMQQMAQKMQQQNQEGEETQNEEDAQQLRSLLKSLVNSSFEQESVMQTLKGTSTSDPNYIPLAQKQKDIKDNLKTAEDSLYALSRRIPQIQSTVNGEITSINDHITKALENLGDRRTAEANRNQQYTMTSMNNLALMLSEALDHMQDQMKNAKSGKGKSKKQSMQQMSQQQQQLNQNMQNMRNQMQQQGGNQGQSQHQSMSEQFARMARQQQEIRKQLEQYNKEQTKDGKDGKDGAGNLDKIAKQMEQNEKDLVNKRITDEALKRQQQIQSKLLDAEKAEQEREQDPQREGHAGKDMPPGYIKALQSYQQTKQKQTEQVKTVPPALNLYYKQKIKTYFDQLNAK